MRTGVPPGGASGRQRCFHWRSVVTFEKESQQAQTEAQEAHRHRKTKGIPSTLHLRNGTALFENFARHTIQTISSDFHFCFPLVRLLRSSSVRLLHLDEDVLPLSGQTRDHRLDDGLCLLASRRKPHQIPEVNLRRQFPLLIPARAVLSSICFQVPLCVAVRPPPCRRPQVDLLVDPAHFAGHDGHLTSRIVLSQFASA